MLGSEGDINLDLYVFPRRSVRKLRTRGSPFLRGALRCVSSTVQVQVQVQVQEVRHVIYKLGEKSWPIIQD